MERVYFEQFTFLNLLTTSLALIAIYFLLLFTSKLLPLANNWGAFGERLQAWIGQLILVFEPLTIVLIVSYFVLINPIFHGIIVGLVILIGFNHLKNYFNGRITQFTNRIKVGQKIKIEEQVGIVTDMDRLGILLKTSKGIQAIGYTKLFDDGFMVMSGDDVGGYYYLLINPIEGREVKKFQEKVLDFLATAPYLDHNHSLVFNSADGQAQGVKTRVIVKEERHLQELLTLIKENGFECKISKK